MLRSLPTGEPQGVFHAVSTRDGEAVARDGQPYFRTKLKGEDHVGEAVYEIEFADGLWMLVTAADLGHRSAH
jgi:hypothetical protein